METTLRDVAQNKLDQKFASGREKISQFVIDIQNELGKSEDFLAPFTREDTGRNITFTSNGHLNMNFQDRSMRIEPHAVSQLAAKLAIPTDYLRKLSDGDQERRDLAAYTLNSHRKWMNEDKRFLLRTVDNEVRGVLSDSYKRINSKLIINAFFKEVKESDGQLADVCLTPTRYWMEALIPRIIDVPTEKNGMVHMAFGVRIGNSDFGDGALDIRSFMFQAICTNGMVRESLMKKVHLGRKLEDSLMLSEKTYALESETMASIVRDITKQALNTSQIRTNIAAIQRAAATGISLDKEFLNLAGQGVAKGEIIELKNLMVQSDPNDGIFGEATIWSLCQGLTALGRNISGRREREFAQIAGELLDRVSLSDLQIAG